MKPTDSSISSNEDQFRFFGYQFIYFLWIACDTSWIPNSECPVIFMRSLIL